VRENEKHHEKKAVIAMYLASAQLSQLTLAASCLRGRSEIWLKQISEKHLFFAPGESGISKRHKRMWRKWRNGNAQLKAVWRWRAQWREKRRQCIIINAAENKYGGALKIMASAWPASVA